MVVATGGAPVGAEDAAPGPVPPAPAGRTRREVARGLRAGALAGVLAPVLAAFRFPRPGPATANAPSRPAFERTYRGRRIRGVWVPGRTAAEDGRWHVTVDGRPLHLMRRAGNGWLSSVDHYCSYRTPLGAARAAVDALGPGERLRDAASAPTAGGHAHGEGRHGVRA